MIAVSANASAMFYPAAVEVFELRDDAQHTQRFQVAQLRSDNDPILSAGAVVLITDVGRSG